MASPIDRVGAGLLLIILLPLLLIIALAIRLVLGTPVIFSQTRIGYKQKPFKILKFRTLRTSGTQGVVPATGIGAFLRATSLDELPELFNVIRGDMSFVGPRPLIPDEANLALPHYPSRFDVLPGITGLAQVRGRNKLSWTEKFTHDVYYAKHRSWKLDLKILLQTIPVVLLRQGINREN